MPSWLIVPIAGVCVLAIFLSTDAGHRLAGRLRIEIPRLGGPARADRAYLERVCHGDVAAVERLLESERRRYADLSEAEIYRRAIRTHMNRQPHHPPGLES